MLWKGKNSQYKVDIQTLHEISIQTVVGEMEVQSLRSLRI